MCLVQLDSKISLDKREIETLTVIGYNDLVFPYIFREVIQIATFDIIENRFSIIKGYGGDSFSIPAQPRCLDIQINGGASELREKSPVVAGGA